MRLTTIILLACLMQVSAATFAQRITLNQRNTPLKQILKEIRQQSGYDIYYDNNLIPSEQKVTIKVEGATVEEALNSAFSGLDLTYQIEDKLISITKKKTGFQNNIKAALATIDVHGRVVDDKGLPLPGVTVKLKDEKQVTTTDKEGSFTLRKVNEKGVVVISFVGYVTKEINAATDLGTINLEISNSKLDEVQIIAYGTTLKRFSTGNIASVKGEEIAKQPVSNPLLALEGRVPGLFISQTTGQSAGNVNVIVQGRNSITKGNDPFFVVDGIPYVPQFTGSSLMGNNLPGDGGSTFNFINPADIESIEILKDADATAIYGSRAANGAILITTKKGRAGQTKVDLNMQSGGGKITRRANLLTTEQYLEMRREAYKNDNLPIPTINDEPSGSNFDLTIWEQNKSHDWQDELVGGTAKFTTLQTSISGGSERTQFLAGIGYNRQTTVYPDELADKKYNVHLNINHSSENKKFNFMLNTSYMQANNQMNNEDLMKTAVTLAPNAPDLYDGNGSLNWGPYPNDPTKFSYSNPLAFTMNKYSSLTDNLLGNALLSYEIISGLKLKSTFGYNSLAAKEMVLYPIDGQRPDVPNRMGSSSFLNKSIKSYIVEPQLTYQKTTTFGDLDFLFGGTFQQTETNVVGYNAYGFSNNTQLSDIASASSVIPTPENNLQSLYKYSAVFARINYRLNNKYIVNVTARRDGSSRFGDENKFNNFYSFGGAWLFAEEPFIKQLLPFFSTGKIKVNYGTTGNDQIGNYSYASLLENIPLGIPYQGIVGIRPFRHDNPFLQWEETKKINIGLDVGLLNDRIFISGNYFRNRSSNQLIDYQLPYLTGFNTVTLNFPATVQNTGVEVTLDFSPIKSTNFDWKVSANATIPKNKLVEFQDLPNSTYAKTFIIGKPINIIRVFDYAGVDPTTGSYVFRTAKGELTPYPSYSDDMTGYVDNNPKWYGGLSNSIKYKNFQLDFLFQYVKQTALNDRFLGGGFGLFNQNAPEYVFRNRWQKNGDVTDIEKFTSGYSLGTLYGITSTAQYSDASYLRLKNASFSYTIPKRFLKKEGISNIRIFLQGQNLLTFTKYQGTDPETALYTSLPPLRMFTGGFQLTL